MNRESIAKLHNIHQAAASAIRDNDIELVKYISAAVNDILREEAVAEASMDITSDEVQMLKDGYVVNHTYQEGCALTPKTASACPDLIPVIRDWTDHETGHRWLHFDVPAPGDWEQVSKLPKVLAFDGDTFVRTGWNSDKGEAYYRNHMPVAQGVVDALKNTRALIDTPIARRHFSDQFSDDVRASVNTALAAAGVE